MVLAQLSAGFQSLTPLSTSKLGPSGADSQVGGFVCVLGPCGSLQQTLLWGLEFLLSPQPPQVFLVRGFGALFPCAGTLGCMVCLASQFSACKCRTACSTSCHLASSSLHPGCLLVWMNVSPLTP